MSEQGARRPVATPASVPALRRPDRERVGRRPSTPATGGPAQLVLSLQHTAGNRATAGLVQRIPTGAGPGAGRTVVSRMPTRAQVITATGKQPKASGSGRYKAALTELDDYQLRCADLIGAPDHVGAQAAVLHMKLDRVSTAFLDYLRPGKLGRSHAEGRVGTYFRDLLSRMGRERSIIADAVHLQERSGGAAFALVPWSQLLGANQGLPVWAPTSTTANLYDVSAAAAGGGALGGGQKVGNLAPVPLTLGAYQGRFAADDKVAAGPKWILNKYGSTFKTGDEGPDQVTAAEDPRLAQRSVAMSRLDAMLGGGVIARTELAVRNGVLGTFMKEARGKQLRQAQFDDDIITDGRPPIAGDPRTTVQPELARLLSRLQLIDAIAGQVDRHRDNLFIRFTAHDRRVIEVTGIDLDMAWSTTFDPEVATVQDHYPGFSRFVDKQLALRIIALDPAELRLVLQDLLVPAELDAAVARLVRLQQLLADLHSKGKLLEPHQWTQMAELHQEQTSYMARAINFEKLGKKAGSDLPSATDYVAMFPGQTKDSLLEYLLRRRLKTPRADVVAALTAIGVPAPKQAAAVAKFRERLQQAGLLQGNW